MVNSLRFVGAVTALTCLLGSVSAQADTKLQWKFKEGESLNYGMEQKMVMKMQVQGMDIEMSMNQTIDMTWVVKSVDDKGVADMVQKIDRIRFTMDGPFGKSQFDSQDGKIPEDMIGQLIGPILQSMAGAEFSMKMNPQGEVSDVKLPEKLLASLNQTTAQFGFSEDSLKQMTNQSGVALPEGSVEKGKTWDKNIEIKQPFGTLKINSEFTYLGAESRGGTSLEKIGVKAEQSIEPAANAMVELSIKSQDSKGTIFFDNKAGRMAESEMKMKTTMEISVMGQMITQSMDQTITVKLADGEAKKKSN